MLRRSAPQIASQLMQGQETGPVAAPAKDWLHSCRTTGDKAIRGDTIRGRRLRFPHEFTPAPASERVSPKAVNPVGRAIVIGAPWATT